MIDPQTKPLSADAVPRLRWWREVLLVVGFYLAYSWVRNQFGSAAVDPQAALDNADIIIDLEAAFGLDIEVAIQSSFLDFEWFLRGWNIFYGTFHFIVTIWSL